MSDRERQLEEDRALRNSARKIFRKELAHVRRETRPGAIGERIANRVGERADGMADAAVDFAEGHAKTVAAAAVGALAAAGLWFARAPIAEKLGGLLGNRNEDDAGDGVGFGGDKGEEDQDE
jgi:hypothetical protein